MTYKQKILVLFLFLISLILKDCIIGILEGPSKILNTTIKINDLEKDILLQENTELSQNYGYTNFYPYELAHSKVLYKIPYNYQEIITIYKGSNHSVKKNNLVINDLGLVGIITEVMPNSSEVTLLTNKETILPVKINSAYGTLFFQDEQLYVRDIKSSSQIKVGDYVYTSDISSYPEAILIGQVETIALENYDLEQLLTIKPAVDFNNINYLSIILNNRSVQ